MNHVIEFYTHMLPITVKTGFDNFPQFGCDMQYLFRYGVRYKLDRWKSITHVVTSQPAVW